MTYPTQDSYFIHTQLSLIHLAKENFYLILFFLYIYIFFFGLRYVGYGTENSVCCLQADEKEYLAVYL